MNTLMALKKRFGLNMIVGVKIAITYSIKESASVMSAPGPENLCTG